MNYFYNHFNIILVKMDNIEKEKNPFLKKKTESSRLKESEES